MLTEQQLVDLYGNTEGRKLWEYVTNKNTGGRNNAKGNRYENHLAIFKLAELMSSNAHREKTLISSQIKSFIDDLIIDRTDMKEIEYYQIKDVQQLSWSSGAHSLVDDVKIQHGICMKNGNKPHVVIVVSSEDLKKKMVDEVPADIKEMAKVLHFANATSINNLVRINKEFKASLERVCSLRNPGTDKLDVVGSVLLGVWGSIEPERVPLKDYIEKCFNVNPNYFRGADARISERLFDILSSIKDFQQKVQNSYIVWRYRESDSGVLSHRIGTREYEQWENDIFQLTDVKSFEDIEALLV